MNSKNLSKAINRVLAILLTAAMVAGSFTVPVKADEMSEPAVAESTTDDAAGTSDGVAEDVVKETPEPVVENNTSTGEETSEETGEESTAALEITEEGVEEALGTADPSDARYIKVNESALNTLFKDRIFNGEGIARTSITNCFQIYDKTTGLYDGTDTAKLNFTFYKKTTDGWSKLAEWIQNPAAGTQYYDGTDSTKSIFNAGTYRVDVEFYDDVADLNLSESREYKIGKVNVSNWTFAPNGTATATTGAVSVTTGYAYNVTAKEGRPTGSSEEVPKPIAASNVSAVGYTVPTAAGNVTKVQTAFANATSGLAKGNINISFKAGKDGAASLYNATPTDYTDAEKPKLVAELKETDNNPNFEGTIEIPFTIAQKSGVSGIEVDDADDNLVVEVPVTTTEYSGTVDLTKVLKGEIKDAAGIKLHLSDEIKSVGFKNYDADKVSLLKFFKNITNTYGTVPAISFNGTTLSYTAKASNDISGLPNGVKVNLTFTLKNYDAAVDATLIFVPKKDDKAGDADIVDENGGGITETPIALKYTGKAAEFSVQINDDGVNLGDSDNFTGVDAYFYTIKDGKKTFIKKVHTAAGTSDPFSDGASGSVKFKVKAPEPNTSGSNPDTWSFSEIGDYSVVLVYTGVENSEGITPSVRKTINFKIEKETNNQTLTVTVADSGSRINENGKVLLRSGNTNIEAKDIKVVTGSPNNDELDESEYEIKPGNENAAKGVWTEANKLIELKKVAKYATALASAVDLSSVYTNSGGLFDDEFVVVNGSKIEAVGGATADWSTPKYVFTDQPYAVVQIKDGAHYKSSTPVYVRYEINDSSAVANPNFKTAYTVGGNDSGMTIPLTGAYLFNGIEGNVIDPDYFTVEVTAGGSNVVGGPAPTDEVKPSTGIVYTSQNLKLGNTITFEVTPHFAENRYISPAAASFTITVTCKPNVTIETTFGKDSVFKTNGKSTYTGSTTALMAATSGVISAGDSTIKVDVKSGTGESATTISTTTKSVLYQLADETKNKNPNSYDLYMYKNQKYTCDATSTYNPVNNMDTDTGTITKAIEAKTAGHYLVVTKLDAGVNYTAAPAELPFEIEKKLYDKTNAKLALINSDTVEYKSANWTTLMSAETSFETIVTNVYQAGDGAVALNPNIGDGTGSQVKDHYTINVGTLKKKDADTYIVPVSITAKEDDLSKVDSSGNPDPYINNFKGTIEGEVIISNKKLQASDFKINILKEKVEYTGEVQKPKLISISYKNQPYTGTETEILSQLKTAIDAEYFEPTLLWPGDEGAPTDGKAVGNHKLELKIGGLYELNNPTSDHVYSGATDYEIKLADNKDIVDAAEIEMILPTGTSNTTKNDATAVEIGELPKTFTGTSGKEYTIASYDFSAEGLDTVAGKDAAGSDITAAVMQLSVTSGAGGITSAETNNKIKVKAYGTGSLSAGDTFTFNIPATVENYKARNIPVKVVVKAASQDTTLSSLITGGFASGGTTTVSYNRQNAEERIADLSDGDTLMVTQANKPAIKFTEAMVDGGLEDGKIVLEWYKAETAAGEYTACELADTKNVGFYKARVTLVGAKNGYYMTPKWTNILAVATKNIANTDRDGDIVVDDTGLVYTGELQYPAITVKAKEAALYTATSSKPASAAFTLDQGTDFKVNANGGETNAGEYTIDTTSGLTAGNISGNILKPAAEIKWNIEKKDITIILKDNKMGISEDATTSAEIYALMKDTVTGVIEGEEFVDDNIVLTAKDSSGNAVAIENVSKTAGVYDIDIADKIPSAAVKKTTGGDTGSNYKVARASKGAKLTVQPPEDKTVTAEIKVGDTLVSNGKKIAKPATGANVTAIVKDNKGNKLDSADCILTVKNEAGETVDSIYNLGKYTITVESANKAYVFKPAIEVSIEVVDKIPYDVESVVVSPASITLKKSGATDTIKYSVYGLYEEASATEPVDEAISIKPATSENFSITDNSDGTITVKALTDTKGITEKFEVSVVSAPDVKPATFTLKTTPSEPGADAPSSDTPDDDAEYTTLDDEKREAKSFVEIQANIARLSKSSYTYNGKPCTPNPTVKATVGGKSVTLVKDQDYRVVYEENIDAGIATVKAYGINDYIGTVSYRFLISPKKTSGLKVFTSSATVSTGGICGVEDIGLTVYDGTAPLEMGEDEDYTATLTLDKGKGALVIKGQGNYTGEKKVTVPVVNLKNKDGYIAGVALDEYSFVYDGKKHEPKVTVTAKYTNGDEKEIPASDYTVKYSNQINAGVGYVTVTGKGKITGKVVKSFTISEADKDKKETKLTAANVKLSKYTYVYNGKLQYPKVTVSDPTNDRKKLTLNKDYRVLYHDNLNVGTACVDVFGIGNYEGQELFGGDEENTNLQYKITPADISGVKVEKDTSGKIARITYKKRVLEAGKDYDAKIVTNKSGKYELHIYGHYNYIENEGDTPANFSSKVKNGVLVPKKQSIKNKTDVLSSIGAIDTTITE